MSLLDLRELQSLQTPIHRTRLELKLAFLAISIVSGMVSLQLSVLVILTSVILSIFGRVFKQFLKLQLIFASLAALVLVINWLAGVDILWTAIRIVWTNAIASASYLLVATTPPDEVERFLRALRLTESVVNSLVVSWNLLPSAYEEVKKVMAAQRARGLELGRNPVTRALRSITIIVPMLFLALVRSEQLERSLRARGFED